MCFSAGASFGAGVVLSVIGVTCIKKNRDAFRIPFAGIPLIFAAQQITEGFLWLALRGEFYPAMADFATYLFLFFAQVVWPTWVAFSILKLESNKRKKRLLRVLLGTGIMVSMYLAFCLIKYNVKAEIVGHHISYQQEYPARSGIYGGLLYVIVTIVPPFVSGLKKMFFLGAAILLSYIITEIFYKGYIVSVWCFFAAIISVFIYIILEDNRTSSSEMTTTPKASQYK